MITSDLSRPSFLMVVHEVIYFLFFLSFTIIAFIGVSLLATWVGFHFKTHLPHTPNFMQSWAENYAHLLKIEDNNIHVLRKTTFFF